MNSQVKVWNGPECMNFCPSGGDVYHPPGPRMSSLNWELSKPLTVRIFMDASSCRHDQLFKF